MRFLPHVNRTQIALAGGIAIEINLALAGGVGDRTKIADIDFVASSNETVLASVTEVFLVSHYHLPQPNRPGFMIQLVDPMSSLRIDIFPDVVGSIRQAHKRMVAGEEVLVLDADSLFDHKLLILSKASEVSPE